MVVALQNKNPDKDSFCHLYTIKFISGLPLPQILAFQKNLVLVEKICSKNTTSGMEKHPILEQN